ncbi:hypothetical protein JNL27_16435 [bacterium]|nr:hypothetical protein [bacterium]
MKDFDISPEPIKIFLDAADSVLNSNTFLLRFEIHSDRIEDSLLRFLKSDDFMKQLTHQDTVRGWRNLYYYDEHTESYKLRHGTILKEPLRLQIEGPPSDKREYLTAMLTGDTTKGRFFSFYGKQLELKKAEAIVDDLTSFLSDRRDWELLVVQPDFLKDGVETNSKDEDLHYFEGGNANDNAVVIKCNEKGFLLLTNGID